jgi:hypothetical protein
LETYEAASRRRGACKSHLGRTDPEELRSVFTTDSVHDGPLDPGELFRTNSTDSEFLLNTGQLGLPGLSWTEKKTVTTISTILTYIDDVAPANPLPYMDFQRRYALGLPQLDPVLDSFAEAFKSVYELWDMPFANFMVTSALDFITATCVENTIPVFTPANRPGRFPWFLRSRTGAAIAYCAMIFPKSGNHDFSAFFRAAPDMEYFSAVTNDLLSFYKEYLANESDNYIHHRAHAEEKSPLQVLSDIKGEMIIASENVIDVLTRFGSEASVKAWEEWETGFVLMHFELARYKLEGLNLAPK